MKRNYIFLKHSDLSDELIEETNFIFVVGWQYVIHNFNSKYIIFHDSLLPKYRGFSPTVTALINGNNQIGVTAIKASEVVDRGDIYEQIAIKINYPIKIKEAYSMLAKVYVQIAEQIIDKAKTKTLNMISQIEEDATYSVWRDEEDYFINWNWDSKKIARFVDAVGWPYSGAKTIYQSKITYIEDVIVTEDIYFEDRHPGKIWSLKDSCPEVICGQGILKIISAKNEKHEKVNFKKLRSRFKNLS
jgi:methionyl-tRNA formyltransferase